VGDGDAIPSIDSRYIPGDGVDYDGPGDGLPGQAQDASRQNSIAHCDNRITSRLWGATEPHRAGVGDQNSEADTGTGNGSGDSIMLDTDRNAGAVRPMVTDSDTDTTAGGATGPDRTPMRHAGREWSLASALLFDPFRNAGG
jgi:hypothetical protein